MTAQIDFLVSMADRYIAASDCKTERAASVRIFDQTTLLEKLRDGSRGIGVEYYYRSLRWLRDHWPEGHEVPPEIAMELMSPTERFALLSAPSEAAQ